RRGEFFTGRHLVRFHQVAPTGSRERYDSGSDLRRKQIWEDVSFSARMHRVVAHMKDINIAVMVGNCRCLWPIVGRDGDRAYLTALAKPQRLVEDCRADVLVPE